MRMSLLAIVTYLGLACSVTLTIPLVATLGVLGLIYLLVPLSFGLLIRMEANVRRRVRQEAAVVKVASLRSNSIVEEKVLAPYLLALKEAFDLRYAAVSWDEPSAEHDAKNTYGAEHERQSISANNRRIGTLEYLTSHPLTRAESRRIQEFCVQLGKAAEISELLQSRQQAVARDPLSGCYSEPAFRESLEHRLEEPGWLMVGLFDLDDFKQINDRLGHEIGDRVIAEVGKRLRSSISVSGSAARLHGDEFAWWQPCEGASWAMLREQLQRILESLTAPSDLPCPIALSIGATLIPPGYDVDMSLREADEAMYRSKMAGKNRFTLRRPQSTPTP
jgi:diguanylate cyclase (GGDEF)-like protein